MIDAETNAIRKNPYRNQIDYILIRNGNNIRALDSKSHANKVRTVLTDFKHIFKKQPPKVFLIKNLFLKI